MTKIGLALGGGGAKGLAHIGVLKVLEEAQVPIHLLAGTSMGGIVAALYAAGRSAAEIEELTRSTRLLTLLQRDRSGLGLIGQAKIADRLREALDGALTFDRLKLPLALIATDLVTGEEVIMRDGSVVEAILATMAVPPVFPPVEWQGRLLADGGILNQVPFDVVRAMGNSTAGGRRARKDTRVIAVHVMRDLSGKPGDIATDDNSGTEAAFHMLLRRGPWGPMIDVIERAQCIMIYHQVEQRLQQSPPDLMIEVTLGGVGLLDLSQLDACLQAGEEAARRCLPELIELRDTPPGRSSRWWRSMIARLIGRTER